MVDNKTSKVEKIMYNTAEIAFATGLSVHTVRDLLAKETIPSIKIGRRKLVRREALESFFAGRA
jgi:excisionase family DNA binding protein